LIVGNRPSSRTASATASDAMKENSPTLRGAASARNSTETYRLTPAGENHGCPIRPRPSLCDSASTVVPSAAPERARSRSVRVVESTSSKR
jgi:hypothetical protein